MSLPHALVMPARPAAGRVFARAAVLALALTVALLAGCASLPRPLDKPASSAVVNVVGTPLAEVAAAATPADKLHLSGVRLLPDAAQAFELRLALARAARKSIDVQYYVIAHDDSGGQFLRELERAAERGVRVRLLVDDLHVADTERALQALAARPGVEVRLFNPLPVRQGSWKERMLLSLHEFDRVNRRMHNKLLVADNAFAVTGGRNVADEYFMRGASANFVDMDIVATGPIVRELSDLFDRFWNSEQAYPIATLADAVEPTAAPASDHAASRDDTSAPEWTGLLAELRDGQKALRFAPVQLFADLPAKAASDDGAAPRPATAMDSALNLFRSAEREVQLVSPYFVPGQRGMALIRDAAQRGVRLTVMTNSLASTDEPMAYWGYARYRSEMLSLGVTLIEMNPVLPAGSHGLGSSGSGSLGNGSAGPSVGRLHAKVATIDQRWLLIGSMNMDGRSSRTNTELALVVDSAELAADLTALLQERAHDGHFRLRLAATPAASAEANAESRPQVEWVGAPGPSPHVHRVEPQIGWLSRMRLGLVSLFVPEDLL